MAKKSYIFIDFAVLDGPAMFEVLRPFEEKGYICELDYSFGDSLALSDRTSMKILGVSFDVAAEIGEALDKASLDIQWMHYEEEPTRE